MAGSLFDQLKSSGLVSDKKAKQVQNDKKRQAKTKRANKSKKGEVQQSEAAKLAAQAAQDKAKRDQELNQQRHQAQEEKANKAELKQIIQSNQLKHYQGEIAYNFADAESVKTLHINKKTQRGLAQEQLKIVHFNKGYAIVSAEVIDKILQRNPNALVQGKSLESELSEEDKAYYENFEIPDDLVW